MPEKSILAAAGNTLVPAYLALQQKGYTVRQERLPDADTCYAENATCRFIAEDPVTLLGLVALYETRGDEWQATDDEIDAFIAQCVDAAPE